MVFKCSVCGYVYDEEAEGKPFSELTECPMCKQPAEKFEPVLSDGADQAAGVTEAAVDGNAPAGTVSGEGVDLHYPKETRKTDSNYRYMK